MTGVCRFCGQIVAIEDEIDDPQENGWMYCDCAMSRYHQFVERRKEDAREAIEEIFGAGCEAMGFQPIKEKSVVEQMKRMGDLVAEGMISSVTMAITGGGKAVIKQGKKGKVSVTRQIVTAQTMETGEIG